MLTNEELEKLVREEKRKYYKEWYRKNREKKLQANKLYWVRRVLKQLQQKEGR